MGAIANICRLFGNGGRVGLLNEVSIIFRSESDILVR